MKAPISRSINPQQMRTLLSLSDQFIVSGTRFVTSWMIARYCGAEQLGFYALGFTIFVLIELLHQAFVSAPYTIFSQRVADNRHTNYTANAFSQALLVSLFGAMVFVIAGIYTKLAFGDGLANVMFALALTCPFGILREFGRRQSFAEGRFDIALSIDSLAALIQLGLLYALLEYNYLDSVSAHLVTGIACSAALAAWMALRKNFLSFNRKKWKVHSRRHIKFGRWVFVSQVTNQLSWNLVQWIIAIWISTEANGLFVGCMTIVFLTNPFVLGVANMLYPRLAYLHEHEGEQRMKQIASMAVTLIAAIMLSFSLVMFVAGQTICDWMYDDPAYSDSNMTLTCLALAVSFLAISMPLDGCLWAKKRTDLSSIASTIGMTISVLIAFIFISRGIDLAALGLLIGCGIEALTRLLFFLQVCSSDQNKTSILSSTTKEDYGSVQGTDHITAEVV